MHLKAASSSEYPSKDAAVPGSGLEKHTTGIYTELHFVNETEVSASP